MSLPSGTRLGPYEITAPLGMGVVYRAADSKLKRDVAIKVLPAALTKDKERLAWPPDGREIWFSASKSGLAANIYAIDSNGAIRTLLAAPGTLELHDVAADGRALVARVEFRSSVLVGLVASPGSERDLTWLEQSVAGDPRTMYCYPFPLTL